MKLNDTKYLTFLDDDDVPKPNYFDKLVKTAEYSQSDVVSTFFHVFKADSLANPLSDPVISISLHS
jgi:GT2 family glycosyltransferase